ncbi:hypothetical protein OIU79_003853, partial [Salix purpurea]
MTQGMYMHKKKVKNINEGSLPLSTYHQEGKQRKQGRSQSPLMETRGCSSLAQGPAAFPCQVYEHGPHELQQPRPKQRHKQRQTSTQPSLMNSFCDISFPQRKCIICKGGERKRGERGRERALPCWPLCLYRSSFSVEEDV